MPVSSAAPSLILTYHGVDAGPSPLFLNPVLFAAHLDVLDRVGAEVLTVTELTRRFALGTLAPRSVALTFDDGFASVAEHAAPLLTRRGWPATVYCVAGHVDGRNDWSTQPATVPSRPLLTGQAIADLAQRGFEIGAHSMSHVPLGDLGEDALEHEVVGSARRLQAVAQAPVTTFACPYGDPPSGAARTLIEATYVACCGTRMSAMEPPVDVYALPRIDAHYFRRPARLAALLDGRQSYLRLRAGGARARRTLRRDFVTR